MKVKYLQVMIMDNGEILCGIHTIGFLKEYTQYVFDTDEKGVLRK